MEVGQAPIPGEQRAIFVAATNLRQLHDLAATSLGYSRPVDILDCLFGREDNGDSSYRMFEEELCLLKGFALSCEF
jgi:hypothetical protein